MEIFYFFFFVFSDADDEGIGRDSDDIDDEKWRDTKEFDQILDVSIFILNLTFN